MFDRWIWGGAQFLNSQGGWGADYAYYSKGGGDFYAQMISRQGRKWALILVNKVEKKIATCYGPNHFLTFPSHALITPKPIIN